jgi:hypothetical protein
MSQIRRSVQRKRRPIHRKFELMLGSSRDEGFIDHELFRWIYEDATDTFRRPDIDANSEVLDQLCVEVERCRYQK